MSSFWEESIKDSSLIIELKRNAAKDLKKLIQTFKECSEDIINWTKLALVSENSDYLAHIGPLTIIADLSPNDLRGILINYIKILTTPNVND